MAREAAERARTFCARFGLQMPILLAPMAGASPASLSIAVGQAGGMGALGALVSPPDAIRRWVADVRAGTAAPFQLNTWMPDPPPRRDAAAEAQVRAFLEGWGPAVPAAAGDAAPIDAAAQCEVFLETKPAAVSSIMGLLPPAYVARLKDAGIAWFANVTTLAEARAAEDAGADVIVAQGFEAGGHRGMFLTEDISAQVGTLALVPQIVDAVKVPVIAAGGIADARGIAAAFALGADGVQIGSAYLRTPDAKISAPHRAALNSARDDGTVLTNVITGRPARGFINRIIREQGPISDAPPQFPLAAGAVQPLRAKAEAQGSGDFSPLWSGQAAALGRNLAAGELTQKLAAEAIEYLRSLAR